MNWDRILKAIGARAVIPLDESVEGEQRFLERIGAIPVIDDEPEKEKPIRYRKEKPIRDLYIPISTHPKNHDLIIHEKFDADDSIDRAIRQMELTMPISPLKSNYSLGKEEETRRLQAVLGRAIAHITVAEQNYLQGLTKARTHGQIRGEDYFTAQMKAAQAFEKAKREARKEYGCERVWL